MWEEDVYISHVSCIRYHQITYHTTELLTPIDPKTLSMITLIIIFMVTLGSLRLNALSTYFSWVALFLALLHEEPSGTHTAWYIYIYIYLSIRMIVIGEPFPEPFSVYGFTLTTVYLTLHSWLPLCSTSQYIDANLAQNLLNDRARGRGSSGSNAGLLENRSEVPTDRVTSSVLSSVNISSTGL